MGWREDGCGRVSAGESWPEAGTGEETRVEVWGYGGEDIEILSKLLGLLDR